jgi:kynurenine formamidase
MKVVDLSHTIEDGNGAYAGLPGPSIAPHLTRTDSIDRYGGLASFQIDRISMVGNTGTYLDAPYHRYPDGADMAAIDLARHVGLPGAVVTIPRAVRAIGPEHLPADLRSGSCVLFETGWDRLWGTPAYMESAPFLSARAAHVLARAGVAIVGIDSPNLDDVDDLARPAHTVLLRHNVGIVEHLRNLGALGTKAFHFFAAPPAFKNVGSFPVRAFAILS